MSGENKDNPATDSKAWQQEHIHELQLRLAKTQRMLETSRAQNAAFLTNLSREIRTPLNGIMGCLGFLRTHHRLTPEQEEQLRIMRDCAEHLLSTVGDMVDFISVQEGARPIESLSFDLVMAVEEVLQGAASRAHERGLELFVHVDSTLPRRLVGDVLKLQQILHNLVTNGVKFSHTGHVVVRLLPSQEPSGEVRIRFEVEDTGIGLQSDDLTAVFTGDEVQPEGQEYRFGTSSKGLAICRTLVRVLDGEMGAMSELGVGSTFWFELTFQEDPEPWDSDVLPSELKNLTVLIMDPNPIQCAAYQAMFDRYGIQGECVSDMEEGWRMIEAARKWREPYSVVIAEFVSAEAPGGELSRRLSELRAQTAVVFTAIYDGDGTTETARSMGADEYLVKPFRTWEMFAAMSRVLKVSRAHRAKRQSRDSARRDWAATRAARNKRLATKARVLLAEDNLVNQKVAKRMLENLGCRVDVAENGREAFDMAQRYAYDLMFLDCQMPGMDGFEATEKIRIHQSEVGSYVPIVAMTANALSGDREKCISVGMDDFLAKPVSEEQLGSMVRHWVGRASS